MTSKHWWLVLYVVAAAIAVWFVAMSLHAANAEDAQPKWKIIVTLDGPPGKQGLTYGSEADGIHWFKDKDECEKARKGGDKKFAEGMAKLAKLQADMKKNGVPVEITTACVMDNSV